MPDLHYYMTQYQYDAAWSPESIEKFLDDMEQLQREYKNNPRPVKRFDGTRAYVLANPEFSNNAEWRVMDYRLVKGEEKIYTRGVQEIVDELDGQYNHLILDIDNPLRADVFSKQSTLHYMKGTIYEPTRELITFQPEVKN